MTVFVTGGAGFIGSALVRALLLHDAAHVAVYDDLSVGRFDSLPPDRRLEFIEGDIRDRSCVRRAIALIRPAAVVHLAALHFIPYCELNQDLTWQVNVHGTRTLLEACDEHPPRTLFFASSAAVYGHAQSPIREDASTEPVEVYGRSKVAAEHLLRAHASRSGTHTTMARFFNVYGPAATTRHVIPEILSQVQVGDHLRLGTLDTVRDYLHVQDVVSGILALMSAQPPQAPTTAVFNIGSGEGRTVSDIVAAFARATGKSLSVTREESRVRRVEPPMLVADVSKMARETGWKPSLSLDAGISALVARAALCDSRQ